MIHYKGKIRDIYLGSEKMNWGFQGSELVYEDKEQYFVVTNSVDDDNFKWRKQYIVPVRANIPCRINVRRRLNSLDSLLLGCKQLTSIDISKLRTSRVTAMAGMFSSCSSLTSVDFSANDLSSVFNIIKIFYNCTSLSYVDFGNLNHSKLTFYNDMFAYCASLNHIRCTQAFKDWCLANQSSIKLPDAMKEGGSGTWEIVD